MAVQSVIRILHAKGKNPALDLKAIDWTKLSNTFIFLFRFLNGYSRDDENIVDQE